MVEKHSPTLNAESVFTLMVVVVNAKTVTEASLQVKNPAGRSEIDYILAHPDSKEANKLKDGNFYFFFGVQDTDLVVRWNGAEGQSELVPYIPRENPWVLRWNDGKFRVSSSWEANLWTSDGRAVLRG